jgi:benzoate-CoA ligase
VPRPGVLADEELVPALEEHLKGLLAPFKCPRWYTFIDDLPKTATGKIQRFKLREPPP